MSKHPLFSIITSSYNSDKTITKTIESLLSQSFLDFEYIIVDGKSNDNTLAILEKYTNAFKQKGIVYKWISEKDNGIYDAWNKGLKIANGQWISFLGSDDYYLNNALKDYSEVIIPNVDNYDWVYSNVSLSVFASKSKLLNNIWNWKDFRRNIKVTPAHVGSFHNKRYFEKYGNFNSDYKIAGDYEMLLRAKQNLQTCKLNKTTVIMGAGGVSNNAIKSVLKETLKAKYNTAGVNIFLCYFDYYFLRLKLFLKQKIERTKKIKSILLLWL